MSAAGALLNVSHAAIGQQVRTLEERLGVQLFVREGRGIALTAEGQRLGGVLREAFGSISREIEDLTGADADRPLQVTTTPSFAARWLMPRLGSFRAQHPDIDLMLNPTADVVDLAPGGVELAVRFGKGDWKGLESTLLLRTPFVITAARSLIGDRTIDSPAELLDFPWLQEIGTDEAKEWLTGQGVAEGRVRNMTSLPGNLLQDALRSGEGVAATALAFVEREVDSGDIVVLFQDDGRGAGYFLVTRPGVQRPALRAFMRWLVKEAQADG